jgi:aquaporin Z
MVNRKAIAEAIGTFWLVFGGVGSALFAGDVIGVLGVSLCFGLTVVTMAYSIGHISGAHLNPAVSVGLFVSGRLSKKDLPIYLGAQFVGGIAAALLMLIIAKGKSKGFEMEAFRQVSNGFGDHSPGRYSLLAVLVTEVVATFMFMFVILGATAKKATANFAGLAIGLCLALVHAITIPISNTSVNPARSLASAAFGGGWAIEQVWLFLLAPCAGAALAGLAFKKLDEAD